MKRTYFILPFHLCLFVPFTKTIVQNFASIRKCSNPTLIPIDWNLKDYVVQNYSKETTRYTTKTMHDTLQRAYAIRRALQFDIT